MIFEKIREKLISKRDSICKTKNDCIALSDAEVNGVTFANFDDAIDIINQVEVEYNQTVTNADRIRHMTDEELAEFLLKVNTAYAEPCMVSGGDCKYEDYPTHDKGCKDCFLEYLRKEVEEKDE